MHASDDNPVRAVEPVNIHSTAAKLSLGLAFAVVACGDSWEPPFEGARRIELASHARAEALTADEASQLVADLVETYGGRDRIEKLTYYCTADRYDRLGGNRNRRADAIVWYRTDDMLRINVTHLDGTDRQVLHAGEAYMSHRLQENLEFAKGEWRQSVWWAYRTAFLPAVLISDSLDVKPLPPEQRTVNIGGNKTADRLLVILEVFDGHLPKLRLWVDLEGPLIRFVEATLPFLGSGSQSVRNYRVAQDLEDHRRVDGVLFPFRRRAHSDEGTTWLFELSQLDVNADIPDDFFDPR